MKYIRNMCILAAAVCAAVAPGSAWAQETSASSSDGSVANSTPVSTGEAATTDAPVSPLLDGGYTAVMGTYQLTQDDPVLKHVVGATGLIGYRNGFYALETGIAYTVESGVARQSFKLRTLLFPFQSLPTLYGLVGGGLTRYTKYPHSFTPNQVGENDDFYTADLAAGLGYMLPIKTGNYEWAIRAEALFELGDRFLERQDDFRTDIDAPSTYKDVVFNLGLQLPTHKAAPPPPPAPPVAVVAPPVDSDGDGVIDELDQCPGTPQGTPVDDKGCPLPPPPPPCKEPIAGERVSLTGCNTGDVLILRGVNFEFDKSKLTPNAMTILNNVGDELVLHTQISVEIGGHTDSKGSDSYNQRLSELRAESVANYLTSRGVARDRMQTVGYGETQPVADNETDEGRELNRRVELKIMTSNVLPSADAAAPTPTASADLAPVTSGIESGLEQPADEAATLPPSQ